MLNDATLDRYETPHQGAELISDIFAPLILKNN